MSEKHGRMAVCWLPSFEKGIAVLEQLLDAVCPAPKETLLLSNYPNPFNPETWIPYHLAKSADVTLYIYSTEANRPLRKSFAQRLYDRTGDIFAVQEMLGHKSVSTTQKYLGVNYANIKEAVEEMSLESELDVPHFLGGSLKKEKDETLFLELALRGYDLSKPLREDDEAAAEIVKIS